MLLETSLYCSQCHYLLSLSKTTHPRLNKKELEINDSATQVEPVRLFEVQSALYMVKAKAGHAKILRTINKRNRYVQPRNLVKHLYTIHPAILLTGSYDPLHIVSQLRAPNALVRVSTQTHARGAILREDGSARVVAEATTTTVAIVPVVALAIEVVVCGLYVGDTGVRRLDRYYFLTRKETVGFSNGPGLKHFGNRFGAALTKEIGRLDLDDCNNDWVKHDDLYAFIQNLLIGPAI